MGDTRGNEVVPEIPFCVGRSTSVSLARQIAEGIRSAIASGYYKPGQVLPTRKEFARALGVSERAPREAVALLAAEGVVYTRRCLGCVVAEPGERKWLGKVLLVESDYVLGYYHAALFESFCRRMMESGYTVTRIACPGSSKETTGMRLLKDALRQPFDFVISLETDRRVVSLLKGSGVRHLVFSRKKPTGVPCEECISIDVEAAMRAMIDHCERRGVRSIVQVGLKGMSEVLDLRDFIAYTGIRLSSLDLPVGNDRTGVENITYGVMQAFLKRLSYDRKWLPDLLFFRDDFAAVGALTALLAAGVRVPEDVRVVTMSNRGNRPVFPKSLARIEIDPLQNGIVYAERVLHALAPSRFKRGGSVAYGYIPGETFP